MNQYQVSFGQAISRAFTNYCCFTGRASRSEYWWWVLFCYIVSSILFIPSMSTFMTVINSSNPLDIYTSMSYNSILQNLWGIGTLLPSLGLLFRRLHDANHSGWNICWVFLPIAGVIILLVYLCQPSFPGANKYGPVPNQIN